MFLSLDPSNLTCFTSDCDLEEISTASQTMFYVFDQNQLRKDFIAHMLIN